MYITKRSRHRYFFICDIVKHIQRWNKLHEIKQLSVDHKYYANRLDRRFVRQSMYSDIIFNRALHRRVFLPSLAHGKPMLGLADFGVVCNDLLSMSPGLTTRH